MAEQAVSEIHEYLEIKRVEESRKEFREYVAVLRRHKFLILAVTVIFAAATAVIALALPAVYRSQATILVQEQEVPPELVRSTVTSYADERIQVISQQVLTRAVLLQLVEKYDLYEKYRDRARTDDIIEFMRKDIKIATIDANISDRSSGRRVNATIAFNISYDSPHPDRAQKVVNELVSLYLNENVKARQQSAAETTAFLTQEADRLGTQIQDIETKLAAFKRRNLGRMPDSSAVNLQLAERTDSELLRIDREISMLQDRRFALESQLSIITPNLPPVISGTIDRVQPSEERLRTLQAQYATASALYGADHPDIRRLQREISMLKGESGPANTERDFAETLKQLEGELAKLKERYSEDHPDIQRLRRSIAALKASGGKDTVSARTADKVTASDPVRRYENPAYIALLNQIENTKREVSQLTALKEDMRAKQRTYDSRLLQIPEVEREYRDLTRDYENAQTRYREVRAKQMQAEIAQELEKNKKAERFSLTEPANLPHKPHHPNRLQIMLGGLIASFGAGLGLAWLREAFDASIKGPLELARIATAPLLTAIPYIETRAELAAQRRQSWLWAAVLSLFGVTFLLGVHIFLKPLSEVLESLTRRIPFV
jgi:polysaccharide biosynthesis transport protein